MLSLVVGGLELNTTVLTIPNSDMKHDGMSRQHEALEDIEDSIAVATGNLGLLPGVAFQARVLQLAHLSNAHRAVSAGQVEQSIYMNLHVQVYFTVMVRCVEISISHFTDNGLWTFWLW